ncbi:hypothetical protein D3C86_1988280 [compost metagenome]
MLENIASAQVRVTLRVTSRANRSRFISRPINSVITNRISPTLISRRCPSDMPRSSVFSMLSR